MDIKLITPENIKTIFTKKGYKFFENDIKNYNLNIIGIRCDLIPDKFNDYIVVMWKFKGKWETRIYNATTKPGLHYLKTPLNSEGTAIVVPNQYTGVYEIGMHQGKYTALRQKAKMDYYRDNDKDSEFDINTKIYSEIGYTNIHRASEKSVSVMVDKWSAGCQVIASGKDWIEFITLCEESSKVFKNSFTYTLIEKADFDKITK